MRTMINLDGAVLHVEIVGEGPPVVVLPGGPGFGYLRRPMTDLLGGSFQMFFIDQRGCGRSTVDDPSTMSVDVFVEDLEAARAQLGLDRLHLLGHSFGGLHAMSYAIAQPEATASLTLVDSDPSTGEQWARSRSVLNSRRSDAERATLATISAQAGGRSAPEIAKRYFDTFLRAYFIDGAAFSRLDMGFDGIVLANLELATRTVRAALSDYDLRERLRAIDCPSLVITGSDARKASRPESVRSFDRYGRPLSIFECFRIQHATASFIVEFFELVPHAKSDPPKGRGTALQAP